MGLRARKMLLNSQAVEIIFLRWLDLEAVELIFFTVARSWGNFLRLLDLQDVDIMFLRLLDLQAIDITFLQWPDLLPTEMIIFSRWLDLQAIDIIFYSLGQSRQLFLRLLNLQATEINFFYCCKAVKIICETQPPASIG